MIVFGDEEIGTAQFQWREIEVTFAFARGNTRKGHFGIHGTLFPGSNEG